MLVMMCKGAAWTGLVDAGSEEGLEASRVLALQHEPTSSTRSSGLLQELRNFNVDGDIGSRSAQAERAERISPPTFRI